MLGVAWLRWREEATQKLWPVPEAVVTVLCTPDDGCGWHPKHVEWTCRIINRLLFVASRWTFINIYYYILPCLSTIPAWCITALHLILLRSADTWDPPPKFHTQKFYLNFNKFLLILDILALLIYMYNLKTCTSQQPANTPQTLTIFIQFHKL